MIFNFDIIKWMEGKSVVFSNFRMNNGAKKINDMFSILLFEINGVFSRSTYFYTCIYMVKRRKKMQNNVKGVEGKVNLREKGSNFDTFFLFHFFYFVIVCKGGCLFKN